MSDLCFDPTCKPGLVSVIIPMRNRSNTIRQTLESVRAQCYRPIECIVVDDGSDDDSSAVANDWSSRHAEPHFSIQLVSQKQSGAPRARNAGIARSQGEYIQFLDSDDALHPAKISRQVRTLEKNPAYGASFGNWHLFEQTGERFVLYSAARPLDREGYFLELLQSRNFCVPHAYLWRRSSVVAIGPWDESLVADQDGDYVLRYLLLRHQLIFCSDATVYYRAGNGISARRDRLSFESRYKVLSKVFGGLVDGKWSAEHIGAVASAYRVLGTAYAFHYPKGLRRCLMEIEKIRGPLSWSRRVALVCDMYLVAGRCILGVRSRIHRMLRGYSSSGYQGASVSSVGDSLSSFH